MYYLMKTINLKLLKMEVPLFFSALFVSEMFYQFHSFTLELFAFFCTWYFLSYAVHQIFGSKK